MALLWPQCGERKARHRLRQGLYQIRKFGAPVAATAANVLLSESDIWLDYAQLPKNRRKLLQSLATNTAVDFLPGYQPDISEPFSRWLEAQRDSVRALLRQDLETALVDERIHGDLTAVVQLARACLDLDPLNHNATLALAEAQAALGNAEESVGLLDRYCREVRALSPTSLPAAVELRRRILSAERLTQENAASNGELIGRADILKSLEVWVGRAPDGTNVLALCGEAGIGKTRLLKEGVRLATLRGFRSITYRPSATGEDRPLAGILDLLPRLLKLPGALGCTPESYSRLSAVVHGFDSENSPPVDRTDSAFRYASLRRSVLDLVDAIAAESEVLLALDDTHWLDAQSLEILLDAARDSSNRLRLLLAVRPGSASVALAAQADVSVVRLPRLNEKAARTIVTTGLDPAAAEGRSQLIDWAVDLADGNPFFLVELSAHCRGTNPSEALPESLQVAIRHKLDGLSNTARLMVQACAVLGQCSTIGRVEAMLALPPHEIARGLHELEAWALVDIRESKTVGCRHDLIAEEVTRGLSPAVAAYLHRRCAMVLDSEIQSSPASTLAWDCARHWDAAGDPHRAFGLTMHLADRLLALGLPKAAADLCTRAERYATDPVQHADRLLRLRHACRLLYNWDGVMDAVRQRGLLLTGQAKRPRRYSDDEIALFEARWYRDYDGRVLRSALHRLRDVKAPSLHRLQMAVIALIVADNHQRRLEASEIAHVVDEITPVTPQEDVESSKARLIYHTAFGDLDAALLAAHRVIQSLRLGRSSATLLRTLRWASVPMKLGNKVDDAAAALTEAYTKAARLGLQSEMWHNAASFVDLYVDCEDADHASRWGAVCTEVAGDPVLAGGLRSANFSYLQARIALMRGDTARAAALLCESRANQVSRAHTCAQESLIALDVLVRLRLSLSPIPRNLVLTLRQLHLRSRDSGIRDFETGALLAGLVALGERDDARALYDAYLMRRRCRLRKHSVLREAEAVLSPSEMQSSS